MPNSLPSTAQPIPYHPAPRRHKSPRRYTSPRCYTSPSTPQSASARRALPILGAPQHEPCNLWRHRICNQPAMKKKTNLHEKSTPEKIKDYLRKQNPRAHHAKRKPPPPQVSHCCQFSPIVFPDRHNTPGERKTNKRNGPCLSRLVEKKIVKKSLKRPCWWEKNSSKFVKIRQSPSRPVKARQGSSMVVEQTMSAPWVMVSRSRRGL